MRRAYRNLIAQSLLVNLKTDKAFSGVLWDDTRDLLVLRNVTMHEHGTDTEMDGEVVIERVNIDFIQKLPA